MPDLGNVSSKHHQDPDEVQYYGCKITTDRGTLLIDYRNDSNGYYGGSLAWPDEHFYGGVFNQQAGGAGEWVKAKE